MGPQSVSRGLLIAAPASGSGKTVTTLALLRAFRNQGLPVASAKAGPDYIDPAFHAVASGRVCRNLDTWAMRPETLAKLVHEAGRDAELVIGEGVMGLFDGAADGGGSTASLAELTGWPVVLVVDAKGMAASAAALVAGFVNHRPEVEIAGVIFNRVGGGSHAAILEEACRPLDVPVLGAIPRAESLALPERHLGLVQAEEHPDLEAFLERAAEIVAEHLDLDRLAGLARLARLEGGDGSPALPPLGQRIAVARDPAFAFSYPFVLDGWRSAGAELGFFSPLQDEAPDDGADAVYLPGGYPELYPGRLAGNRRFMAGVRQASARGAIVYGECGGFMVLGQRLADSDGERHAMAGLLPVETSFAEPKLTLGYREAVTASDGPLGPAGTRFRGHEFHFANLVEQENNAPLFHCQNASGDEVGAVGLRVGRVMGSFLHLVDRV